MAEPQSARVITAPHTHAHTAMICAQFNGSPQTSFVTAEARRSILLDHDKKTTARASYWMAAGLLLHAPLLNVSRTSLGVPPAPGHLSPWRSARLVPAAAPPSARAAPIRPKGRRSLALYIRSPP